MDYKIVWTEHAIEDYHQVIVYLLENWSEQVAMDFIKTVQHFEKLLLITPLAGKVAYKDLSVRGKLIIKHNKINYRIIEDNIQILQMRDTSLNPSKNPFE